MRALILIFMVFCVLGDRAGASMWLRIPATNADKEMVDSIIKYNELGYKPEGAKAEAETQNQNTTPQNQFAAVTPMLLGPGAPESPPPTAEAAAPVEKNWQDCRREIRQAWQRGEESDFVTLCGYPAADVSWRMPAEVAAVTPPPEEPAPPTDAGDGTAIGSQEEAPAGTDAAAAPPVAFDIPTELQTASFFQPSTDAGLPENPAMAGMAPPASPGIKSLTDYSTEDILKNFL